MSFWKGKIEDRLMSFVVAIMKYLRQDNSINRRFFSSVLGVEIPNNTMLSLGRTLWQRQRCV